MRERIALAVRFEAEADDASDAIVKLVAERAMLLKAASELRHGPRRKPRRAH
jgi:hypothetical protein